VPAATLLQQAEEALRQAIAEERRIRRGMAEPGSPITWDDLSRCQHQSRQAQDQLDKLQRSQARLLAEIPSARIDARRTAGDLAALEDETRRRLIRARRAAQQAREELGRMVTDLVSIAGPQAVPVETESERRC
jgi:seryl-tRNA synthetase